MIRFAFSDAPLVRSFFRDILTGKDGDSYDIGRVSALVFLVCYLALGVFVAQHSPDHFTFIDFGGGFAAAAGGLGVFIKLKENTEPNGAAAHDAPVR